MSEREPEVGSEVVIQLKDDGPLFFGRVVGRRIQGVAECGFRPVAFRDVYAWFLVPSPPPLPKAFYDDDVPF